MSQVSPKLRKTSEGYSHWCPACEEMHHIWTLLRGMIATWTFNGDLVRPTFGPSVKLTGKQKIMVQGEWTGEYKRGLDGAALDRCCHYFLVDGIIHFQSDCTHAFVNKAVELPNLPRFMQDDTFGKTIQ